MPFRYWGHWHKNNTRGESEALTRPQILDMQQPSVIDFAQKFWKSGKFTHSHPKILNDNYTMYLSGGWTTSPLLGKPPGDLDARLLLLPALVIHKHQVQEQWSGEVIIHEKPMTDWSFGGRTLSFNGISVSKWNFLEMSRDFKCIVHWAQFSSFDIFTGQSHNREVVWNKLILNGPYLFVHLVFHQPPSSPPDVGASVLLLLPPRKNLFRDVGVGLLIHLLVQVIHLQQEAMRWL